VFIHGQHRNPLNGTSDLQTAYACFQSKQKVRFLWYQFLEDQTLPKTIAKTRERQRDSVRQQGRGAEGQRRDRDQRGASRSTPFQSNGSGRAIFQAAMNYLDQEMFASCLAGFADLAGAAASGPRLVRAVEGPVRLLSPLPPGGALGDGGRLSNFAIADLVRWNLGRQAKAPSLRFGELTAEDVSDVVAVFQALATSVTVNPAVPTEFVELLTEKVAEHCGLDVDRVRKALDQAQANAPQTPSDQLQAGIDAAARLVAEAGVAPCSCRSRTSRTIATPSCASRRHARARAAAGQRHRPAPRGHRERHDRALRRGHRHPRREQPRDGRRPGGLIA
jgi:hypothetical protein